MKANEINWEDKDVLCDRVDFGLSVPIPINEADLSKPFIYCREFGVFYCSKSHAIAMAYLRAVINIDAEYNSLYIKNMLFDGCIDVANQADLFIEHVDGACFRSTMSKYNGDKVTSWSINSLNPSELRYFKHIEFISDNSEYHDVGIDVKNNSQEDDLEPLIKRPQQFFKSNRIATQSQMRKIYNKMDEEEVKTTYILGVLKSITILSDEIPDKFSNERGTIKHLINVIHSKIW